MKKTISALLVVTALVFGVSTQAFAATTMVADGNNSIEVSQIIKQENKTITVNGSASTEKQTIYTIPAGATVQLNGSGNLIYMVMSPAAGTDSYTLSYDNFGQLTAPFTIPKEWVGKMVLIISSDDNNLGAFCQISGQSSASDPANITATSSTYRSDTGSKIGVRSGKTYQFKITSLNGKKPVFVSGNSSVFQVSYKGNKGNDYYFMIHAVGSAGQSTGIYINGSKTPNTIAAIQ